MFLWRMGGENGKKEKKKKEKRGGSPKMQKVAIRVGVRGQETTANILS